MCAFPCQIRPNCDGPAHFAGTLHRSGIRGSATAAAAATRRSRACAQKCRTVSPAPFLQRQIEYGLNQPRD
ncbi:MAG: hypothetical protein E5Y67_10725, partial [Mesorhizobium sp.]